jgi:hypothetical protein
MKFTGFKEALPPSKIEELLIKWSNDPNIWEPLGI